jgi:hypothetical protein
MQDVGYFNFNIIVSKTVNGTYYSDTEKWKVEVWKEEEEEELTAEELIKTDPAAAMQLIYVNATVDAPEPL